METHRKELLLSRIISGCIRLSVDYDGRTQTFLLRRPSRLQLYIAHEVFHEALADAKSAECYSDEDLYLFLLDKGFWDEAREKELDSLLKDIDNLKVSLYKATFKSNEKALARKTLTLARARVEELQTERYAWNHVSSIGAANMAKARYLLGVSLRYANDLPVFTDETFWTEPSNLLDSVSEALSEQRISDTEMREIARTDPWRSLWAVRSADSLFGNPVVDWSEEQRSLVQWAQLYDNIHEHPECPLEEVINDDDCLDGWLIEQRRKREKGLKSDGSELITSEKIKQAGEVFLMADTEEDAKKIYDLNDAQTKAKLRGRFKFIKEQKGEIDEVFLPDVYRQIQMDLVNKLSESK